MQQTAHTLWLALPTGQTRYHRYAKRPLDAVLAFLGLILLLPVLALEAMVILIWSGRPILFRQKRLGQHGNLFTIYKFRTMRPGSDVESPATLDCDPRVTRIGRLLRRWHLDELPQLLNILRGEMSLIGPRPWSLDEAGHLKEVIPEFCRRLDGMPGLTGLAQIRYYQGGRADWLTRIKDDHEYLASVTLRNDLAILWKTITTVCNSRRK